MAKSALFLLALVLAATLVHAQTNCKQSIKAPTGESYDISSLSGQQFSKDSGGKSYKVSICADAFPSCGLCASAGFCEKEEFYENCIGVYQNAVGLPGGAGVELAYPNGEFGKSGVVRLMCDSSAGTIGDVQITNSGDAFTATVKSSVACPGGGAGAGGVSPGGVILIILLVLIVVYLVGGGLFLRFGRGEAVGPDLILFRNFWGSIPGLALEGVRFTWGRIRGLFGRN